MLPSLLVLVMVLFCKSQLFNFEVIICVWWRKGQELNKLRQIFENVMRRIRIQFFFPSIFIIIGRRFAEVKRLYEHLDSLASLWNPHKARPRISSCKILNVEDTSWNLIYSSSHREFGRSRDDLVPERKRVENHVCFIYKSAIIIIRNNLRSLLLTFICDIQL